MLLKVGGWGGGGGGKLAFFGDQKVETAKVCMGKRLRLNGVMPLW